MEIMNEEISVDWEGLAEQVRESSRDKGFTIKVWVPYVDENETKKGDSIMPLVDMEGYASPFSIAVAIKAMETTIDRLTQYDDVDIALDFLENCASKDIVVRNRDREEKEDDKQ